MRVSRQADLTHASRPVAPCPSCWCLGSALNSAFGRVLPWRWGSHGSKVTSPTTNTPRVSRFCFGHAGEGCKTEEPPSTVPMSLYQCNEGCRYLGNMWAPLQSIYSYLGACQCVQQAHSDSQITSTQKSPSADSERVPPAERGAGWQRWTSWWRVVYRLGTGGRVATLRLREQITKKGWAVHTPCSHAASWSPSRRGGSRAASKPGANMHVGRARPFGGCRCRPKATGTVRAVDLLTVVVSVCTATTATSTTKATRRNTWVAAEAEGPFPASVWTCG